MIKKLIIDCEVRVVHEKARKPNFLSHSKEKIVQDIYKHPKINKAVKLWGVESIIKSMNKQKGPLLDLPLLAFTWNFCSVFRGIKNLL